MFFIQKSLNYVIQKSWKFNVNVENRKIKQTKYTTEAYSINLPVKPLLKS